MAKGITKALLGGKLMFPSEYVAAIEFGGKDVTLTIASVQMEKLQMQNGRKEQKPTLSFNGTRKKLVLNKTNAGTIADLYGIRAEEWVGKKVTLYPTKVNCGGDTVDAIRVRARVPGSNTPPPPAEVMNVNMDEPADDGPDLIAAGGEAELPVTPDNGASKSIGDANAQPPADIPIGQGSLIGDDQ